jgi:hypothetical protein
VQNEPGQFACAGGSVRSVTSLMFGLGFAPTSARPPLLFSTVAKFTRTSMVLSSENSVEKHHNKLKTNVLHYFVVLVAFCKLL